MDPPDLHPLLYLQEINAKLETALSTLPILQSPATTASFFSTPAEDAAREGGEKGIHAKSLPSSQKLFDRLHQQLADVFEVATSLQKVLLRTKAVVHQEHPEKALRYEIQLLQDELTRKNGLIARVARQIADWQSQLDEVVNLNLSTLNDQPDLRSIRPTT